MTQKVPIRPTSPAKTEVLHKKHGLFLLKNTTQPRKKPEVLREKMTKNGQKRYQKEHPAPLKARSFAWKIKNRPTLRILEFMIPTPNFTKFLNP